VDEADIRRVHESAFGAIEGRVIADLTVDLLHDPSAKPLISLLAWGGSEPVGHVLFTSVRLSGDAVRVAASILAPLAVCPGSQRQGVGTRLVQAGLSTLDEAGSALVFVLGHPSYYTRFGFRPAGSLGFAAPYPIAEKNADAWMVLEQRSGTVGLVSGEVRCAQSLSKPEFWVE
jgi:predicted N-acetyltransferase YhbS